jgi:hypothetical protein
MSLTVLRASRYSSIGAVFVLAALAAAMRHAVLRASMCSSLGAVFVLAALAAAMRHAVRREFAADAAPADAGAACLSLDL